MVTGKYTSHPLIGVAYCLGEKAIGERK